MNEKTPLIRLAKREDMPKSKVWLIRAAAFLLAIVLGGLVFFNRRHEPDNCVRRDFGAVHWAKPPASNRLSRSRCRCLGTALAWRRASQCASGISAEKGRLQWARSRRAFALNYAGSIPSPLLLLLMGIFSILFGAAWAAIPASFQGSLGNKRNLVHPDDELHRYRHCRLAAGRSMGGKPGSQIIPMFDQAAVLPKVFGVHCGWIIVLLLTAGMYIYMNYTKHGYEVAVLGESENTARYAGMNVTKVTIRTACLSGGICGLIGFMVCSGTHMTLYADVAGGVGFTAIVVAWLAQFNPFAMIAISLLLAVLEKGASGLQTTLRVPASIADIITGIILLCMLACEFFINYRIIWRNQEKEGKSWI